MSTVAPMLLSWCPGKDPPDLCDPCHCKWTDQFRSYQNGFNPVTGTGISGPTDCRPPFAIVCWINGQVNAQPAGPPLAPVGSSATAIWRYANVVLFTASGSDVDSRSGNLQDVPFAYQPTAFFVYTSLDPSHLTGSYHYTAWVGLPNGGIPGFSSQVGGYAYDGPLDPSVSGLEVVVTLESSDSRYPPPLAGNLFFNAFIKK